jgi:small-conductance mechanosensitive channel
MPVLFDLAAWGKFPSQVQAYFFSDLYWDIWKEFTEQHIEIPYPQRDVCLKSIPEIRIRTAPKER